MWEWLVHPIDGSRPHEVGFALSWHARLMVIAWGVAVPVGIIAARFFKVLPWQDWPNEIDNHVWWNTHRVAQYGALALMAIGLSLVLFDGVIAPSRTGSFLVHQALGWLALAFGFGQLLSGLFRGTKGGPTDPRGSMRGDHYDMTRRRLLFEGFHKRVGYGAFAAAVAAILTGLWQANAPRWMWLLIVVWFVFVVVLFARLMGKGPRVTTYAAIWGPDPSHPGNRSGEPRR